MILFGLGPGRGSIGCCLRGQFNHREGRDGVRQLIVLTCCLFRGIFRVCGRLSGCFVDRILGQRLWGSDVGRGYEVSEAVEFCFLVEGLGLAY